MKLVLEKAFSFMLVAVENGYIAIPRENSTVQPTTDKELSPLR